jgi:mannose-6-phosphate isomerase-like protein (cupin superfamily)
MSTTAIRQPNEGEILSVVGEHIRILADSAATGGKCLIFENTSPPAGGPPLHRHGRDDEYFVVLEGTLKFSVNGQESTVSAGGAVLAPRGTIHAFVNIGKTPSRMLTICTPGGLEGPFREVDQLTRAGKITMDAVVAAFQRFDLEVLGPPLQVTPSDVR